MKMIDATLIDSLKTKFDNMMDSAEDIKTKLEAQEGNTDRLFIEAKRTQKQLESLQSAWKDIDKVITFHRYQFKKDPATEGLLASCTGLASQPNSEPDPEQLGLGFNVPDKDTKPHTQSVLENLIQKPEMMDQDSKPNTESSIEQSSKRTDMMTKETDVHSTSLKFIFAPVIQVKSPTDTRDCCLRSILLLPDERLLLADYNNCKLKLVDLQTNRLLSELNTESSPFNMCLLPRNRAAVIIVNIGIRFLKTRRKLRMEHNVIVRGEYISICYHNDNLVVAYWRGNVAIMDMRGNVIKKMYKDKSGQTFFGRAEDLTVVGEGQTAAIYVSDLDENTITKLDMDLNILQTFKDPALRGPAGIAKLGNQLLICNLKLNNILCLDLPGGKITQLLCGDDGIEWPLRVLYNPQQNILYVTSFSEKFERNNTVKVYKVASLCK